jgi:hypothetical protein
MQFSWTKVEPINTVRYSYSPKWARGKGNQQLAGIRKTTNQDGYAKNADTWPNFIFATPDAVCSA